jgi:GH43 family beta-xylosidase
MSMTTREKFQIDIEANGLTLQEYPGPDSTFYPATFTDEINGPTLQDVIRLTDVKVRWDDTGKNSFAVYPIENDLYQRRRHHINWFKVLEERRKEKV